MGLLHIHAVATGPLKRTGDGGSPRCAGVFTIYATDEHGQPATMLKREDMSVALVRTPPPDPKHHGWVTFTVQGLWPITHQLGCYDVAIAGELGGQQSPHGAAVQFPPGPYVLLYRILERLGPRLIRFHGQALFAMEIEAGG